MNFLTILFNFLLFPGLLFAAVAGLLACWVDRKVTARLQYRVGPPWFQPFADCCKLFFKEILIPEGASVFYFLLWPTVALAAAAFAAGLLWTPFWGDLIVILYFLTIPSLALIMAGFTANNPVAALGASREMKLILAYELPFLLSIFTVVLKTHSIMLEGIAAAQAAQPIIFSFSGILAFCAALLCIQAKLGLVPFDLAEAEQEISSGVLLEYSGAPLMLFKLAKAILLYTLPLFLIALFCGGLSISGWVSIPVIVLKYCSILVLIIVIKNTNPRLRIDQALRFFWGPVTIVATLALILAMMGA
ncbi:MAG: complex I subunit 1 family protein [Candidatus Margulisiibacteriota bacterium]